MSQSYDHLQESGEPKELGAKVQLAGDVVPLGIEPGPNAGPSNSFHSQDDLDKNRVTVHPSYGQGVDNFYKRLDDSMGRYRVKSPK